MTNTLRRLDSPIARWTLVIGLVIVSTLAIVYFFTSPTLKKLPSIDLSQADPDVSDAVELAVKGVCGLNRKMRPNGDIWL